MVLGKTNSPEHGWKADTDNEVFGATHNPWDLARSAGGSSGGTGAALAAGMVPLATGSDGGGSIRIPSAINGLSGLKPSLGRAPLGGPRAPGWAGLSTKGPMARRIRDVAVPAVECVVAPTPPTSSRCRCLTCLGPRDERHRRAAQGGRSPTLGYAPVDKQVLEVCERAVRVLEGLGTEIVEIPVVFEEDPIRSFLTIVGAGTLVVMLPYRDHEAFKRIDPGVMQTLEWAEANVTRRRSEASARPVPLPEPSARRGASGREFPDDTGDGCAHPVARRGRRDQRHA